MVYLVLLKLDKSNRLAKGFPTARFESEPGSAVWNRRVKGRRGKKGDLARLCDILEQSMQLPPGFPQFRRKVCANYFIHLTPKNSGRLALSEKI